MRPTEHNAKSASTAKTGVFAMLRGLPGWKGSGASKIGIGSVLSVLVAALGGLAFMVAPALGAASEAPEVEEAGPVRATTANLKGVLNPKGSVEDQLIDEFKGIGTPAVVTGSHER